LRYLELRLLVSVWFQILFHRPPGLLFTFPSRYWFTIDHKKCLVLRHSRRGFIRDFTSPELLTKNHRTEHIYFTYGAFTLFGRPFQVVLLYMYILLYRDISSDPNDSRTTPIMQRLEPLNTICGTNIATHAQYDVPHDEFGLIPVRSPLLRELQSLVLDVSHRLRGKHGPKTKDWRCFLFLRLLRCFTSAGTRALGHPRLRSDSTSDQVSPFGHLRIKGCLPPPRSFSQAATSFLGFLCRGIHHTPLLHISSLKHENVVETSSVLLR